MLHNWSDVAISTIDAFTQRVVRPFSRDLRLEYDLRMTTEQTYYREQAVERLIGATGSDDRITALLSQTCLQLLHEERSWNPTKPLLDLSYELLKESSIEPLQRLRAYSVDELTSLTQRLNQSNAKFRHHVNELGAQALELFAMNGLAEGDEVALYAEAAGGERVRVEARAPSTAPAAHEPEWTQKGRVSWYGPGFHGRRTANGEVFDTNELTMAHRTLPFGTEVRVTNLANGRSVVLRVNDRGPYVRGRIADLSHAAAARLGFVDDGVTRARIEVI